ncbi:MAG TPA: hypothetical protein VGX23_15295 [Actinocrinis sp.]|nr:hypothetical protein [Actinocrinis sp.]
MLITIAYRITRKLLGALATVARRDVSKDVELLVLRQLMKLGYQVTVRHDLHHGRVMRAARLMVSAGPATNTGASPLTSSTKSGPGSAGAPHHRREYCRPRRYDQQDPPGCLVNVHRYRPGRQTGPTLALRPRCPGRRARIGTRWG